MFIDQVYQFGMINERRTGNMKDRLNIVNLHLNTESISIIGEAIEKLTEIRRIFKEMRT